MRSIKMSTGTTLPLDGDLLAVLETLYKELTARHGLDRSFEQMMQEIRHLVDQMDEADRYAYLVESLFLNTVTYENEKLGAYMRKLTKGWSTQMAVPIRNRRAIETRPVRPEVRSRERGNRLVRNVRLGDNRRAARHRVAA